MGYSRSAYYKYGMRKEKAENEEFKFLDRVREVRREQPRIGTKKLQKIINEGNEEKIGIVDPNFWTGIFVSFLMK